MFCLTVAVKGISGSLVVMLCVTFEVKDVSGPLAMIGCVTVGVKDVFGPLVVMRCVTVGVKVVSGSLVEVWCKVGLLGSLLVEICVMEGSWGFAKASSGDLKATATDDDLMSFKGLSLPSFSKVLVLMMLSSALLPLLLSGTSPM